MLFAIHHRQVEQGQVESICHCEIDSNQNFFAGAGTQCADKVEETVAE
jgi:hypothetical protein